MLILFKVAKSQAPNRGEITAQTLNKPSSKKDRSHQHQRARWYWWPNRAASGQDQLMVRMPVKVAVLVASVESVSVQATVVPTGEAMAAGVTV